MVKIIPYQEKYKDHFYVINNQWISSMFQMEDIDERLLKNPKELILDLGGFIWFAQNSDLEIIGTCALRKTKENQFELIKMGVLEKARGLKVGEKLLQHVIQFIKSDPHKVCYLLTNAKCEAAIHLYEKNGFVHDSKILAQYGCEYTRCDVAMKLI